MCPDSSGTADPRRDSTPRTDARLSVYVPTLAVGGAERVTVSIANGLADRGYDVDLVVSYPEGELRPAVSGDVDVVELGRVRVPVAGIGSHVPALADYLSRAAPAAVFTQKLDASVVCLAAARLGGADTKVIPTIHSAFGMVSEPTVKSRVLEALAGRLLPSAHRVVAVSQGVAESVVAATAVRSADVSVLHNPVDVDGVRQQSRHPVDAEWVERDDVDLVVFVGRLDPQKDLETWLRAFARVSRTNPDARGIVAGRGPERDRLRGLVTDLGLDAEVSVPGYVDNPYRYMRNADAFLLASRFEGLPTVLIEALACGCQVVATDCPHGPREILQDGLCGRLAPVGDDAALARAVDAALTDPVPTDRLRRRADDFAPDVVLDEYETFVGTYVLDG